MATELKNLFSEFMDKYVVELQEARETEEYKRPLGNLVRHDIAGKIQEQVDSNVYKVKGSVGAGRWTDVPWVAVFDKRITVSAQKGVYIVYLLNKDTKELFLTLNQGATDVAQGEIAASGGKIAFTGIASSSSDKTTANLKLKADNIRSILSKDINLSQGTIVTGSKAYDAGCIYYIKYTLNTLPDDEVIFSDLDKFVEAYSLYHDLVYKKSNESKIIAEPEGEESEEELSTKEMLEQIKSYIANKGFSYDSNLIENFYLSLKAKPFVLLAGTSGTGKTRLARLFAEAIGAFDDGRYLQVAVKPDWSDSTDLFGHVNLDNDFVPGAIIDFVKKAAEDKNNLPYILCLDEMNLARVEYYLSDFLSVIETRDWDGEHIITDKLVPKICYSGNGDATGKYADLRLPENLYIVGTVNMDETTFPFSKKVLDRANTIEFSYVDFSLGDGIESSDAEKILVGNGFLRADYLRLQNDCGEQWETVKKINDRLISINEILKAGDAHFGYRMRDEIIFYMLYREKYDLITEKEAFDNQIMQKILPRIQGSSEAVANLLRNLFKECAGPFANKSGASDSYKMENYIKDGSNVSYPKSAEKIWKMLRRFEDDDFTSYWV